MIENHKYIDILDHPKLKNQNIFILKYNNYIHAVPFIIDINKNIIIKTIYPSRKFDKLYGAIL